MKMVALNDVFWLELGWFLFFFLLMILFFWRAMQRKIIKVRVENGLKLMSIGVFIDDEGYDHNLQLYKFKFKDNGVKPYHVYSPIPWSAIKALYLSDEIMVIEHLYPFLTLREHKLQLGQYFVDPLVSPPLKTITNYFKRVIFTMVSIIPRVNDKAWMWIDRDPTMLVQAIKVIESDIPQETIEYLYRVEYEERVVDPEVENFVATLRIKEVNTEEVEDMESRDTNTIKKIEPVYAVVIKEEDKEITKTDLMYPDKLKDIKLKKGIKIKSESPAYEVTYFVRTPPDSAQGIFTYEQVQGMKDDGNIEIKTAEVLKAVRYLRHPKEKKKQVDEVSEILTNDKITEIRNDPICRILEISNGPMFVTYAYVEKTQWKEVNSTKHEIDEMKLNLHLRIINIDEIVQSKRVVSFKDSPEEAVSRHIASCDALAVQKMKFRQIASEKEKIQRKLEDSRQDLFDESVDSAKRETERVNKNLNLFQRQKLVLDKILEDFTRNTLSGMSSDKIKLIALRDFQIYMANLGMNANPKEIKDKIQEIDQRIKTIEQNQTITKSRDELEKELREQFPSTIEES